MHFNSFKKVLKCKNEIRWFYICLAAFPKLDLFVERQICKTDDEYRC